ncbi:uncharacterized protein [Clytia hemisphaerica]|uniref:Uncharacterized protein n=1 Tax=Clytia hemisphaerica TaxID=252671 RepID=A0A7M5V8H1_9CNID|eukprot:TCONS_00017111-protein
MVTNLKRWNCFTISLLLPYFATVNQEVYAVSLEEIENSWHKTTTKIIQTTTATIKLKIQRYKAFPNQMTRAGGYKNEKNRYTMRTCAEKCTSEATCASFSYELPGTNCRRFSGVYANSQSSAIYTGGNVQFFEKLNPCNKIRNLCEHGSECVPDILSKSYSCINCFSPYTGKHCNESGPVHNPNISEDILYGRNASCRDLKKNFQNYMAGMYWIHPWRDTRKIKVNCNFDGTMFITSIIKDDPSPIRELFAEDLEDGLNIYDGNFRAHPSFASKLEKLIRFDFLKFKCQKTGVGFEVKIKSFKLHECYNVMFYFLGEATIADSSKYCLRGNYKYTSALYNEWPTKGVPADLRLFKDILIKDDSTKMTFTNDSMQCFGDEGTWDFFNLNIV